MEKDKFHIAYLRLLGGEVNDYSTYIKTIPPIIFLQLSGKIGICLYGKRRIIIPYHSIEKVIGRSDGVYIKYTTICAGGRSKIVTFGPINSQAIENIFLPLYEHELFSKKVEMVLNYVVIALRDKKDSPEGYDVHTELEFNELRLSFEAINSKKFDKIKCLKEQKFDEAAQFRDEERKAIELFEKSLAVLAPEHYLTEATEYFLAHYPELLEARSVAAEGI